MVMMLSLIDSTPAPAGPVADALNLNAGYALAAAKVASSPAEGVAMAQEVQRAGKPAATLAKWIATSKLMAQRESMAAMRDMSS